MRQPHMPTIHSRGNDVDYYMNRIDNMHISYEWTEQDLLSFQRYSLLKPSFIWVFLIPLLMIPTTDRTLGLWYGVTTAILLEGIIVYNLLFYVPKTATQVNGFFGKREFTFSENGFALKWESGESTTNWDAIYKLVERKHYFCLHSKRATYAIPKRAFTSEQQMDEFRQLVTQSIGKEKVA